jgi:Chaperone of endosialidase
MMSMSKRKLQVMDLKHCGRSGSLLSVLPMLLSALRAQDTVVPLRSWATPMYWQPNQAEREVAAKAGRQLMFSANAISTSALTFVAITPCRLVDTRGAAAGFNGIAPFSGPSIAPAGTLAIPIQSPTEATANTAPAPCGAIPSTAQAYSLNLTVVPVAGGAVGYVSLWPSGSPQPVVATVNDVQGLIVNMAAIVPAGTPSGGISVYNAGPATTDVVIDMNGYFAPPSDLNGNTAIGMGTLATNTADNNTAIGYQALANNTTGTDNMASGEGALQNNTTGNFNTASGQGALYSNTTGNSNTATGDNALTHNTTGVDNTGFGYYALYYNTTGNFNTACGLEALVNNTTGTSNTATGNAALQSNTTGSNNIAIGYYAALNVSIGNSNNIHIGSQGTSGDSGVIKLGTEGTQTSAYISGISGANVPGGAEVFINASGQLGTVLSSRRFKQQITDMGDTSSKLFQLRPVNFFYKPQFDDGTHLLQYGLIAEEVAKVYPEMVVYDNDGQILTVKYQLLAPMLLNEVQRQHARLQSQARAIQDQKEQNRKLEDRLAALEALLSGQRAAGR